MSLADFDIAMKDVPLPNGKSFSVRGVSLVDISMLLRNRGDEIRAFFSKYSADDAADQTSAAGMKLLESAPDLAAELIACAADEPKMVKTALRLPISVQLDALEKIAELTFDAEGGPKKFFEAVIRVMQGTTNLLGDVNRSTIGSLGYDDK